MDRLSQFEHLKYLPTFLSRRPCRRATIIANAVDDFTVCKHFQVLLWVGRVLWGANVGFCPLLSIVVNFAIDAPLEKTYYTRVFQCRGVAQPGSASGLGPEGRKFESCLPDHFSQMIDRVLFCRLFSRHDGRKMVTSSLMSLIFRSVFKVSVELQP